MHKLWTIAICCLLTSCVKKTQVVSYVPGAPAESRPARGMTRAASNAVQTTMDRQVRNAVEAGEGDQAGQALRLRVAQEPSNVEARLKLAAHYRAAGFPDLAVEHLRLAAGRFPDRADVQVQLGQSLNRIQAYDEAEKTLKAFLSQHPSAEVAATLGVVEDERASLKEGEAAHRQAVDLAPGRASYRNNLGYNLLLQNRRPEAAAELRRALEIEPRNETARNNLAAALAPSDPKEALAHWKSMVDASTAHSNLAAVLMEQGQYPEARAQLVAALNYRKDHPAALRNLALLAEMDGKPAEVPVITKPDHSFRQMAARVGRFFKKKGTAEPAVPVLAEVAGKQK